MKLGEILTARVMKEIAKQAELNSIAKYEDEFWPKFKAMVPELASRFPHIDVMQMAQSVHEVSRSSFELGCIIAASQTIFVFLETIKQAEVDE